MSSSYEQLVIQKLIDFGKGNDAIRAILLTSSLCNPNAPVDTLSDLDVELFFEDPAPFVESDDWIEEIGMGPALALWHWPNEWDRDKGDGRGWMRMVYFRDGTKMDISLGYLEDLRKLGELDSLPDHYDIGCKVLLDKDGTTSSIKPATYQAFALKSPSRAQYVSRVETFWMDSIHAAKYLWRGDIMAAKFMLDGLTYYCVREILEWSVAMERSWNWKPGKMGRGLLRALDPEVRRELLESYAASDLEDLWESLFRTSALYRKTAVRVGEGLGYDYLHDLDRRVTVLHQSMKALDRQTGTREDLARALQTSLSAATGTDLVSSI